ncbi:DUF2007 domain-containing protein [Luteimonas terricola]|uniref:DUF2007 domain-containing protein n=1 Tax=Luteimonas terricola TaxID=645597 RepID=A0ABQ2EHL6_9GAMM|nr:DUF2007 domain-containing protein [Luteimonas terricola]GGK11808.1 hypothetical protein GCM10011394_21370 [Luteimonas terricola]
MRQLFSSARIENVEAVARLLEEAGIEVRITNGRSYRGAIRGNFSYREGASSAPRPAVWVIRSDQQPEARLMLREAGLLQQTTQRNDNFLPPPASLVGGGSPLAARGGGRFRYGLLLGVAVMVALVMIAWRASRGDGDADPGLATVPAASVPAPAAVAAPAQRPDASGMSLVASQPDDAFVIATPPALAVALLRAELAAAGTRRGCLAIDGADPDPLLLQQLATEGFDVTPASACTDDRLAIAVSDYATDGSGSGTVQLAAGSGEPQAREVRREGRDWLIDAPR